MKTNQLKMMKRHRRWFRFIGLVWAIVGGLLLVVFVSSALDPNSTMLVNGVRTTALRPKLFAAASTGIFVAAGLGMLFMPGRYFDRLFVWRQSLWSAVAFWR